MGYFGKWNDLDFFLHSLSNILIRYNRKSRRCWPACWTQSDINQSLHEAPALHFWRYDIIKYPLLPFYLLTSAPKGRGGFQSVWVPKADGYLTGQMREKAGECLWQSYYDGHISDIYYSFTNTHPLSSFLSLCPSSCSRSYGRKGRWNVSPLWAWHLQIRAHYPGVTCSVPF